MYLFTLNDSEKINTKELLSLNLNPLIPLCDKAAVYLIIEIAKWNLA